MGHVDEMYMYHILDSLAWRRADKNYCTREGFHCGVDPISNQQFFCRLGLATPIVKNWEERDTLRLTLITV